MPAEALGVAQPAGSLWRRLLRQQLLCSQPPRPCLLQLLRLVLAGAAVHAVAADAAQIGRPLALPLQLLKHCQACRVALVADSGPGAGGGRWNEGATASVPSQAPVRRALRPVGRRYKEW